MEAPSVDRPQGRSRKRPLKTKKVTDMFDEDYEDVFDESYHGDSVQVKKQTCGFLEDVQVRKKKFGFPPHSNTTSNCKPPAIDEVDVPSWLMNMEHRKFLPMAMGNGVSLPSSIDPCDQPLIR